MWTLNTCLQMISSWSRTKNRIYILWYRNTYKSQFTCVDFSLSALWLISAVTILASTWAVPVGHTVSMVLQPCTTHILSSNPDLRSSIPEPMVRHIRCPSWFSETPSLDKAKGSGLGLFWLQNIVRVKPGAFQHGHVLHLVLQRVKCSSLM